MLKSIRLSILSGKTATYLSGGDYKDDLHMKKCIEFLYYKHITNIS